MPAKGSRTNHNERDLDALRFFQRFVEQHGYPPTRREIAAHVQYTSASSAQTLVDRLVANNLIEVTPNTPRGARITAAGMVALTEEMT